jgi:hypothetical protein
MVGMILEGKLTESPLYFLLGGIPGHTENFIIISL